MKLAIKKGSHVQVITGADKGKKGKVLEIDPQDFKVKVEGVKVQTHFDRKDGIKKQEGFIHYSNLKLVSGPESKAKSPRSSKKSSARA